MLAEDLNVCFPLTYWVQSTGLAPADNAPDTPIGAELVTIDDTHVYYPLNTEYEIFRTAGQAHTLGAVFVLNHQQPLRHPVPTVRGVAQESRQQGALLDLDKHSWPWSLMIVPIMNVDLFELSNNHLWQTQFGFHDWTLPMAADYMRLQLNETGFTEWGWADFGFQTYYALLNCGFPLRVSAGTASGVHPVQLGFGRVYVHCPRGFRYDDWIAGLSAGKSFVSTGPMLEVNFNGKDPGTRFEQAAGQGTFSLRVNGTASSRRPLDRIELIVNGRIVQQIAPSNRSTEVGTYRSDFRETVPLKRSSWIAVRCFERHPQQRLRFAHTNPVHVQIGDEPIVPRREEVNYLMRRMEEELERNQDVLDESALQEYRDALEIYRGIAERAK